jgi:hypothetical protein
MYYFYPKLLPLMPKVRQCQAIAIDVGIDVDIDINKDICTHVCMSATYSSVVWMILKRIHRDAMKECPAP